MDITQLKKSLKSFKLNDSALDGYIKLYSKLNAKPKKFNRWKSLINPDEKKLTQYLSLPVPDKESIEATLARLAVCKLNGGLGTSMNCQGPKSAIEVRGKKTFVHLLAEQVAGFNKKYHADVPLMFMNSFYTHDKTERILGRAADATRILSFCQQAYPRLLEDDSGFLKPKKSNNDAWYPPGHGDLYSCILKNGYLDLLIKEGREFLFISNADNLGAVIDLKILNYIIDEDIPFLGLIEHTNLVSENYYNGDHILYITNYLDYKDKVFKEDKNKLLDKYVSYLEEINPDFKKSYIESFEYNSVSAAQPLLHINYSFLKPEYQSPINNLYIGNTSQIYPEDRGTNYSVKIAGEIVSLILRRKNE